MMARLKKQVCRVVLDYFDKTYTNELGDQWQTVKEVLTTPGLWQYAVLLNNFQCSLETKKQLLLHGYQQLTHHTFPESLNCYINRNPGKFPSQRHQTGRIKGYYILNASSLLPVLALDVKHGESVLDMCAAPGGKSVTLLQCASPGHLHCNEPDIHRSRWLKETLESFVPASHMNAISTSELDGRLIGKAHANLYDKVLVDVPCSNDRSWLFSSDAEQAARRISERKILPAIQTGLLRSAIHALRPGGSVVYSTCTLSKAENSSVVSDVLNSCRDVLPVDLSDMANTLSHEFTFATHIPHGLLVLPHKGKAWGPMFVSKLIKL
ncbi:tRNA (cytosine(34)-C(5))-methyltransferase, mitochondrial isoform X2 [Hyla sarda]|uniref:tRNA (cytosine(34)-C(5))-methyltransferase, mitochondrial isoform X2 n=1 Tax=Hyla sarda TaxID=327740 RepID=UPI0024C33E71|nr:tRNA (cytosine(34)-C(5))-methyltransferase, mitochondrial isoform X2 [Hyla sarda]XP_056415304.1 tRNA (cytosine(34)-C(5))-methyltransferase, mitochondrial isoform X2 [Hyla sarda]